MRIALLLLKCQPTLLTSRPGRHTSALCSARRCLGPPSVGANIGLTGGCRVSAEWIRSLLIQLSNHSPTPLPRHHGAPRRDPRQRESSGCIWATSRGAEGATMLAWSVMLVKNEYICHGRPPKLRRVVSSKASSHHNHNDTKNDSHALISHSTTKVEAKTYHHHECPKAIPRRGLHPLDFGSAAPRHCMCRRVRL